MPRRDAAVLQIVFACGCDSGEHHSRNVALTHCGRTADMSKLLRDADEFFGELMHFPRVTVAE